MTHDCAVKGTNTYCPKCHRAAPDICWDKEFSHVVENGSHVERDIYETLDDGLREAEAENVVSGPTSELEDIREVPEPVLTPIQKARRAKAAKAAARKTK
jgi:hypothetical protein